MYNKHVKHTKGGCSALYSSSSLFRSSPLNPSKPSLVDSLYYSFAPSHARYTTSTNAVPLASIKNCFSRLSGRSLLALRGPGIAKWLQGLNTNDITPFNLANTENGSVQEAIFSAFLAPQGRLLADVIISRFGEHEGQPSFVIECDAAVSVELQKHMKRFKLREKIDITDVTGQYDVWSVLLANTEPTTLEMYKKKFRSAGSTIFVDPRFQRMGLRAILPKGEECPVTEKEAFLEVNQEVYTLYRMLNGVCEGAQDLPFNVALPLECNLDLLNGVSFTKGCYVGQELTSRVHHTGVIRKRLLPIMVFSEEDAPNSKDIIQKVLEHSNATNRSTLFPSALFCKSFFNQRLNAGASLTPSSTEPSDSSAKKAAGKVLSTGAFNVGMGMVRIEDADSLLAVSKTEEEEQPNRPQGDAVLARAIWPLPWAVPPKSDA